jgi:tripartite-type tricarboxylate transporter receptor subunit TctC
MVLGLWAVAAAQPYPAGPVRIIVPDAPTSLTDISARLVALKLSDALGENVVVENRAGAGGTVGTAEVAKAAPDGRTLLVVSGSHAVSLHLYRNLKYDAVADLAPVALLSRAPLVLVVNPNVPARTVSELVQLAKAQPGAVDFATLGPGSPARLLMEMLKLEARVNVTSVPYKGEGQALADLVGGRVDAMFQIVPGAVALVKGGRLRALAVTSDAPSAELPGVPVMKNNYPDFTAQFWVGMLAPAKTPPAIISRLNSDVTMLLGSEELKTRFGNLGLETVGGTPGESGQWITREMERWGRVIRAQGIAIE